MRFLTLLIFLTVLISCSNNPPVDIPQVEIYSEWINYYEEDDFETYYTINSLATDSNNKMTFSAYIRRNNFTVNRTWIFALNNNSIYAIDSLTWFNNFKYNSWCNQDFTKSMWHNTQLLISYDKEESWYVTSLQKKNRSSRYQIDKNDNIWITSSLASNNLRGIKKYDGLNWTTYFEGSTFYAICIDLNGDLYASTLPDFDEPGIVMRYNYSKWDTVLTCSGNAQWVPCMHFDNNNNLWFGVLSRSSVAAESGDGLYKYDGVNVTHYDIYNSELPSNSVVDIAIDDKDNKWIAMYSGGLAKLNVNGGWTVFNMENTPLTNSSVEHVWVDDKNYVWFTVYSMGLVRLKE